MVNEIIFLRNSGATFLFEKEDIPFSSYFGCRSTPASESEVNEDEDPIPANVLAFFTFSK